MNDFKLPKLFGDGMILQQKTEVHLWGYDLPGRKVMISFLGIENIVTTDDNGIWETRLYNLEPGGPFSMYINDSGGNVAVISDILVGDVWMCSGQSNMELPMERVKDIYPEEIKNCENSKIRTFKITEHADFHGPLRELLSGEWKQAGPDTILQFSATAYFFAEEMYRLTGIPIGLINASLGGSRIESWMGRDMLSGYKEYLDTADRYGEDAFIQHQLTKNQEQMERWHSALDAADEGLKEHWEKDIAEFEGKEDIGNSWKPIEIPFFFKNTVLKGFIGSVWFKRTFVVPAKLAGKAAGLWLGTMVDSDTVYVNGIWAGHTDYQYPPRKYQIPEGILKEGKNTITIRLKCENGEGRFTPGKKYAIWGDDGSEIDLTGNWKYRIGAFCGKIEETDFVNWKPTGLYHGMMAPCHSYTIGGFIWYQGESNTHEPDNYRGLMERLIEGYRKKWENQNLPFFYVQLPNFSIDLTEKDSGWPELREQQRLAQSLPGTGMVTAIDLGEDNDLHPLNKKEVGRRLALLAGAKLYGSKEECSGPGVDKIVVKGNSIHLVCSHAVGMYAASPDKGDSIEDFEVAGGDGVFVRARAQINETGIILTYPEEVEKPAAVRYCFANTNKGALIYNSSGLPMSPFTVKI